MEAVNRALDAGVCAVKGSLRREKSHQSLTSKFDEAVQSARNARLQSLPLQEKIETLLRESRRDVRRVDWRGEAPRLIDEALVHIQTRLDRERGILGVAEERVESLQGKQSARNVSQIIALMKERRLRHLKLHERLMGARNVFLEEQERQSFAPARVVSAAARPGSRGTVHLLAASSRFEGEAACFPPEVRERAAEIFALIATPASRDLEEETTIARPRSQSTRSRTTCAGFAGESKKSSGMRP